MNDLKRTSRIRKVMTAGQGRVVALGAVVASIFAAVGVFHSATHVAVVRAGYDLGKVEARYRELLRENENLKMERATLRSAPRLETFARTRLGMSSPSAGQIVSIRANASATASVAQAGANQLVAVATRP